MLVLTRKPDEGIQTILNKNWTAMGVKNVCDKNWITRK
jgi:hypothetical protein